MRQCGCGHESQGYVKNLLKHRIFICILARITQHKALIDWGIMSDRCPWNL